VSTDVASVEIRAISRRRDLTTNVLPNIAVEPLAFLLHILEGPGSTPSLQADCRDSDIVWISSVPGGGGHAGIVNKLESAQLPSTSFSIHYCLMTQLFDNIGL
jgi:hypothetical protein